MVQRLGKSQAPSSPGGSSVLGEDSVTLSLFKQSLVHETSHDSKDSDGLSLSSSLKNKDVDCGESEGDGDGDGNGANNYRIANTKRRNPQGEVPAMLEFWELNRRILEKDQAADESGGSGAFKVCKGQAASRRNAVGRHDFDVITTPAAKKSRPRHSTLADKGVVEKSTSSSCWRTTTCECGCEECDQESELDEDETELVSQALFEETRALRHRLITEVEVVDGSNHCSSRRRQTITCKGDSELSKCSRCFSYKKSSRFNGSVCTGCKRRCKKEIEEERLPEDIDVIVSRCCKSAEDVRAEEACAACFVVECDEGDEMLQCEGCSIWVHASCYGGELIKQIKMPGQKEEWIPHVPEGDWFCQACEFQKKALPGTNSHKIRCILCPVRIGAFKRTVDGRWMHLSCMRVMNETEAVQPWKQEPLSGICDIKWKKWAQKCMVCGTSAGACVQCHAKDCENMFHVGCAQYAKDGKFVMVFTEEEEWNRLCRDHAPQPHTTLPGHDT